MSNKKQFISVLISVLICVSTFGAIVYATTTIGDNISAGGTLSGTNFSTNETYHNTFVGFGIETTTTASYNTFVGYRAGYSNDDVEADKNVAVGANAFYLNTTGEYNTALGVEALRDNIAGNYNVAVGYGVLMSSTTSDNTAMGYQSANSNSTGAENVAIGYNALIFNTTGSYNTAIGSDVLGYMNTSEKNTAVGYMAGYNPSYKSNSNNSIFGYKAGYTITTGSNNIFMGYQAGDNITAGSNNIVIGYDINVLTATADNFLNIGDLIYGSLATTSAKTLGILDSSPAYTLSVDGTASVSDTMYVKDIYASGVVSASDANGMMVGGGAKFFGGTASPDFSCVDGSLYIRSGTSNEDTSIYLCSPANTWNAINFTTL